MRVLFLVPYPTEGASNRYRVEQYLPFLDERGISYSLRPFISSEFFKILYKRGNRTKKLFYFLSGVVKRFSDLVNVSKFDLVFVHIEAFPFGPPILEWLFSKLDKPSIYDFEDAVYLKDFKGTNRLMNFLRCPEKFYQILRLSSHVIVCNKYMKEYVYPYNQNVTVIPTSIDTEKFKLANQNCDTKIPAIGWIGSHTTSHYLNPLRKVFASLAKKYDFYLKIIGGGENFSIPQVNVINEQWTLEKDVENFQKLDIGIYPLPNDERSKAKTPFKTIQYMSVGIPVVASKVGANTEIVQDGVNGFLVSNEKEWFEKLSILIENARLRRDLGMAGRKTVEERFSLKVNKPKFMEVLEKVEKVYYEDKKSI